MNIKDVFKTKRASGVDLSRVEKIGFTYLMKGGGSIGCSELDWIEVYGIPVVRYVTDLKRLKGIIKRLLLC